MELFIQACGAVLLSVILILSMGSHSRDLALTVTLGVSILVMTAALHYLRPVLDFADTLIHMGGLNSTLVQILFKSAGICILSEISALICSDAGNNSLAKAIQMLAAAVVLWLSLPLFTMLVDALKNLLGGL